VCRRAPRAHAKPLRIGAGSVPLVGQGTRTSASGAAIGADISATACRSASARRPPAETGLQDSRMREPSRRSRAAHHALSPRPEWASPGRFIQRPMPCPVTLRTVSATRPFTEVAMRHHTARSRKIQRRTSRPLDLLSSTRAEALGCTVNRAQSFPAQERTARLPPASTRRAPRGDHAGTRAACMQGSDPRVGGPPAGAENHAAGSAATKVRVERAAPGRFTPSEQSQLVGVESVAHLPRSAKRPMSLSDSGTSGPNAVNTVAERYKTGARGAPIHLHRNAHQGRGPGAPSGHTLTSPPAVASGAERPIETMGWACSSPPFRRTGNGVRRAEPDPSR